MKSSDFPNNGQKKSFENHFLVILLAIGLFGAYYMYNSSRSPAMANYPHSLPERNPLAQNVSNAEKMLAQTEAFIIQEDATAKGELQIQVKNFVEGQKYFLDLGAGRPLKLETEKTLFTIRKAGVQEVKLLTIRNSVFQTIASATVNIPPPGKNI